MIRGNTIYFNYEGYTDRFGNARRPALVRHSKRIVRGSRYSNDEEIDIVTLFIDGKKIENAINKNYEHFQDAYAIVLLEPIRSNHRELSEFDMMARPFIANSREDWGCLFYDTSEQNRLGDRLAYAIIAIALDKYDLRLPIIIDALNSLQDPAKTQVINLIKYASYGLSINKISQINELNRLLGLPADVFFPAELEISAKQYGISYKTLNVNSLVDQLFEQAEKDAVLNPKGFSRIIQWLKNDTFSISLREIEAYFSYLGEEKRSFAIKRYFHDVKKGTQQYNSQSLKAFSSQNYQYYSTLRYIFEGWPGNRNVSTEFLLDCLKTYEQTNQQRFQVSDGILDWAIQKSIEVNRPIEMNFNDWLCYCEGGILINKSFRGFANFEIQYELDDFAFEEDSLKRSIHSIVRKNCDRLFHYETVIQTDPKTGLPITDPLTNKPLTRTNLVYDDRWKLRKEEGKEFIDLFINWSKRPETEPESNVFTPEMVDYSIVRSNVEQYFIRTFGSITPYISERRPDDIVKMFAYPIRMKVSMDDEITLGENPGVDGSVVKQRVKERMAELFGETLECDYDPTIYQKALVDSLFRLTGNSTKSFEKREKMYRWERRIYCAPELSELPNLLTGRKCANCQGDLCFVTCIKKEPDWSEYSLIHILEIIGYHVLEETEAGFVPNPVYIQFVNQINKAIRFAKRLVCKECGHILFPSQQQGHSRFKCLMLSCPEYNNEVYLNYCHDCKKGIIDSRDTKQCPNGLYICPSCDSCCSNQYFEFMAERYRIIGKRIPSFITRNIGNGHKDQQMVFCSKCGAQKTNMSNNPDYYSWRCLICDPIKDNSAPSDDNMSEYMPNESDLEIIDPWA